ncbi:MAG: hypothetical protein HDS95_04625 [Bacteroidales bacterium]|nr:hypothetical protein [Bacteroidales bacterium]MDE6256357.1 hypothetical protein [Muribaculaceae bacterium]
MGFFIAVLIILLLPLIFPYIGRLIKRYAMGKMEDNMRRMMGMPTRAEEKKARKAQAREERDTARQEDRGANHRYGFRSRGRNHNVGNPAEDIRMMRLYAEDVEYIEIREYSADIRFEQDSDSGRMKIKMEEQVSDAEFVIIK